MGGPVTTIFLTLILSLSASTASAYYYLRAKTGLSLSEVAPSTSSTSPARPQAVAHEETLSYESCNRENSYLKPTLDRLMNSESSFVAEIQRQSVPNYVKASCVQQSLMSFPNFRQYKVCRQGDLVPNATKRRPCASEEYVNVTTKSFNIAAECLGGYITGSENNKSVVAESMFHLMAHESGLHANVQSPTGAAGSGQLVKGAIDVINRAERRKMMQYNSDNKGASTNSRSCSLIPRVLNKPMSGKKSRQCERMSLDDGNPLKNMAYTFANVRLNYLTLQKAVFTNSAFHGALSDLSEAERLRLQMITATWAHNTGAAGMRRPLQRTLFKYANQARKVTDVDEFVKELSRNLDQYPHPANSSTGRRRETSQFFNHIKARTEKIQTLAGGSCRNQ